jgi:hypothetical protein
VYTFHITYSSPGASTDPRLVVELRPWLLPHQNLPLHPLIFLLSLSPLANPLYTQLSLPISPDISFQLSLTCNPWTYPTFYSSEKTPRKGLIHVFNQFQTPPWPFNKTPHLPLLFHSPQTFNTDKYKTTSFPLMHIARKNSLPGLAKNFLHRQSTTIWNQAGMPEYTQHYFFWKFAPSSGYVSKKGMESVGWDFQVSHRQFKRDWFLKLHRQLRTNTKLHVIRLHQLLLQLWKYNKIRKLKWD